MLFPTVDFAVFFVIVFAGSWMLRPFPRLWRWFLLGASVVFYLDPFNPAHTEGERFVTANPVLLAGLAGLAGAVALLLRVAFGPTRAEPAARPAAGRAPALAVLASSRPSASPAAAPGSTSPVDLSHGSVGDEAEPVVSGRRRPAAPGAAAWAPALVTGLVGAAVVGAHRSFPARADQNGRWLVLLVGVALVNQAFARATRSTLADDGGRTRASRWLVRVAVAIDLAVLGWFKYVNWFAGLWSDLAAAVGVDLRWLPAVLLPIAISFFTFQAISYVVDVGRGDVEPVSLLDFTVYLTFFAHVVAGPIVRVREFVPQLRERADPRFVASGEAFELVFRGLFKKVVVSSFVSAQIVVPVFDAPGGFSRVEVLFAILGYAVQIYADFSGYTDIAIGVALLLGIRFPQNFDAPYRALSLQDFWRRWHMTLSRWLRDYLYIPLGGSRVSPRRTEVNLLLTMVLGGLWHGANVTFLVWGSIHGVGMAVERRFRRRAEARGGPLLGGPVGAVARWLVTFSVVCVAWVFFNARDLGTAVAVLGQLVGGQGTAGATSLVTPVLVVVVVASIASQFVPPDVPRRLSAWASSVPPFLQVAGGAVALLLIAVLGPEGIAPFIYFQF